MQQNIQDYFQQLGQDAKLAAAALANASTASKNQALLAIADAIEQAHERILDANAADLSQARANNLAPALMDRLALDADKIQQMATGVRQVAALDDPVGQIDNGRQLPSGIEIMQLRVPLGVVGIIYESRPNVTVDAAALCLKSGNAAILRGGSEAIYSNRALAQVIKSALATTDLPPSCVQIADTVDRDLVGLMLGASGIIDVLIPRGGKNLVARVSQEARVPVIKHLDGNCHVYIDKFADLDKACKIAINAKTRRYGVCNAMETLLLHRDIGSQILPRLAEAFQAHGVALRGCAQSCALVKMVAADDADWQTEYLAPILAVKIVAGLQQAIEHINQYGSAHSDAIVTQDISRARQFVRAVDSSSVMVNASTAFADGFEYGLGAEIGISTDKLHARGPVGLLGLTSQKYVVLGDGHIRG